MRTVKAVWRVLPGGGENWIPGRESVPMDILQGGRLVFQDRIAHVCYCCVKHENIPKLFA